LNADSNNRIHISSYRHRTLNNYLWL
jgi:hypothetical protein